MKMLEAQLRVIIYVSLLKNFKLLDAALLCFALLCDCSRVPAASFNQSVKKTKANDGLVTRILARSSP